MLFLELNLIEMRLHGKHHLSNKKIDLCKIFSRYFIIIRLIFNDPLFLQYIGSQIAAFVFGLVGSCVVLDFSTYDSSIQPLIRDVIVRLMNNPQHEGSREILRMVQEGVSEERKYVLLLLTNRPN